MSRCNLSGEFRATRRQSDRAARAAEGLRRVEGAAALSRRQQRRELEVARGRGYSRARGMNAALYSCVHSCSGCGRRVRRTPDELRELSARARLAVGETATLLLLHPPPPCGRRFNRDGERASAN